MADKMSEEDREIAEVLKKAYGFDEEHLLEETERARKELNDSDFPGAEDRIFEKIMNRKAEAADKEKTADKDKAADEEKKTVRFGKKKILLAGVLAAAIAATLGISAIGGKNYFFRKTDSGEVKYLTILDNDKNKMDISSLEQAFIDIENKLNVVVPRLIYLPEGMQFSDVTIEEIDEQNAIITLEYNNHKIYYTLRKYDASASLGTSTDRKTETHVSNRWLGQEISIYQNTLANGEIEYEVEFVVNNYQYRFIGVVEEEEFKEIINNISFLENPVTN